jgi:signal transduction histidine kinase
MLQEIACRRILVVDDTQAIHDDFDKIFQKASDDSALDEAAQAFFGEEEADNSAAHAGDEVAYELSHTFSGADAVGIVREAIATQAPFDVAFVDMRMPVGWDGLRTIEELWKEDSRLHVVLCTAYSDLSARDFSSRLGNSDKLLFLKKPFDKVEALQIVAAMSEKHRLTDLADSHRGQLEELVAERTANLEVALGRAEAANKAKAKFIAVMSHELKTPLNAILGFSGILTRRGAEGLTEMQADAAETINRNGKSLLKMIDQILEYVRIEPGEHVTKRDECNTADILANAVAPYMRRCQQEDISLSFAVDDAVPKIICTDSELVSKILHHLVDNAVKFTTAGGEVRLEANCDEGDRIAMRVIDTGSGISPDLMQSLFEAFNQGDDSSTRKFSGSGLGLTLCERLTRCLGGSLSATSEESIGSTFTLSVPNAE